MSVRIALASPPDFADLAGPTLPATAPPPVARTVIEPAGGWQGLNVRELWRHRELLFFLAWRDVKVRYKQTALGVAWAVLQPALLMVVFTVFFARLAGVSAGDVPYPLFALAGLLPWTFFATTVSNGANSVIGSERLITKIYFPRLAVPFAAAGVALVDLLVAVLLLAIVMAACGVAPSWEIIVAPVIVAIIALAAVGLGTVLAALNVAYRDVRYVVPFLIQVGMFATPTVYLQPTGRESSAMHWLLTLNPMNGLVSAFRACVFGGPIPWADVGIAAVLSVGVFLAGCLYFRRVEDQFADVI